MSSISTTITLERFVQIKRELLALNLYSAESVFVPCEAHSRDSCECGRLCACGHPCREHVLIECVDAEDEQPFHLCCGAEGRCDCLSFVDEPGVVAPRKER